MDIESRLRELGRLATDSGGAFERRYAEVLSEVRDAMTAGSLGPGKVSVLAFRLKNLAVARLCALRLLTECMGRPQANARDN